VKRKLNADFEVGDIFEMTADMDGHILTFKIDGQPVMRPKDPLKRHHYYFFRQTVRKADSRELESRKVRMKLELFRFDECVSCSSKLVT